MEPLTYPTFASNVIALCNIYSQMLMQYGHTYGTPAGACEHMCMLIYHTYAHFAADQLYLIDLNLYIRLQMCRIQIAIPQFECKFSANFGANLFGLV